MEPTKKIRGHGSIRPPAVGSTGVTLPKTKTESESLPYELSTDNDEEIVLLSPRTPSSTTRKSGLAEVPLRKPPTSLGPNDEGYQCPNHAQCKEKYIIVKGGEPRTRRRGDRQWKGKDMCNACRRDGDDANTGTAKEATANAAIKKRKHSPGPDDHTNKKTSKPSTSSSRIQRPPRNNNNAKEKGKGKGKDNARKELPSSSSEDSEENDSESSADSSVSSDDEAVVERIVKSWNEIAAKFDEIEKAKKQASITKAKKAVQKLGIFELQRIIQAESQSQRVLTELTKRSNEIVLAASSRMNELM
ncbi:hypothetical protein ONZ45_g16828 [Pleurotus djamor]|nr:hypothetical protein ONZ45_g16828 [Pleurotus djamor]